ncbi:hypothetical protein [Pseudobacteriovorax antillogorgiicola]|uniref:VWFA domain-containing protein n=1 Tax=Pseudobacteriovorax antillogorgiicola TaxID=1513793 RepID=A0A1Y6BEV7_9BACT|nr:hypothetical protein [Pseudobacteriovorax antillogorgiicola]TCS56294.1 hypothetical protein EDD56_104116 [Pseudobacteriovorax antillogorgiicola]SMF07432.1 hypothetical protein SAMN06296036_104217 [Pseudobacteriovorax antillogorgiicola]
MKLKLQTMVTLVTLSVTGCDESPPPFKELPAEYDGELVNQNPSDDLTQYNSLQSAEWKFQASTIDDVEVEVDLESETIKQFGTMQEQTVKAHLTHEQVTRAQKVEVFKQGSDQQTISEFFKQNENDDAQGLLDVLVVIDNSGSMAEEQANLSTKLMPLLSYVAQSDWRIGVVTTDVADGCLREMIQKNQSNPQQAFSNAIRAGTSGSGIEAGVPQAVSALSPACLGGSSWIRPNSTLAILYVSDEDNCSDGTKCAVDEQNSADYLLDYLATIRQVGVNAKVFGLIWHTSQEQSQCQTALRQGVVYSDLIEQTGGSWGSICDSDYSATLQAMSLDLSLILKTQFALQYTPFTESIEVVVNNTKVRTGYNIIGNVVTFDEAPPAGAKISINYRFTTSAPQASFTLNGNADPSAITVYLDGRPSTDFSYDSSKKQVQFTKPPQAREIKVVYREPGSLLKSFKIEPGLVASSVKASVDGRPVEASAFSYDSASGNVTFNSAPKDSSKIEFQYERVIGPLLSYPVFAPLEAMASVVVYDQFSSPLSATVGQQEITFDAGEYQKGKSYVIEYDNIFKNQSQIDLGYPIFSAMVKVTGDSTGDCGDLKPNGTIVDISACGFNGTENILFSFDYVKEHLQEFSLDTGEYDLDALLSSVDIAYAVTINGEATDKFVVEDRTISFSEELPINAEITVKLIRGHDS